MGYEERQRGTWEVIGSGGRRVGRRTCGKAVVGVFFTVARLLTTTAVASTVLCTQLSWDSLGVIPAQLAGEGSPEQAFSVYGVLRTVIR
jgi:hypothetical protein